MGSCTQRKSEKNSAELKLHCDEIDNSLQTKKKFDFFGWIHFHKISFNIKVKSRIKSERKPEHLVL
jgi:hypothetical protein